MEACGEQQDGNSRVRATVFVLHAADHVTVVAGAKVKLHGLVELETETDESGEYDFPRVPPGTYTADAVSPGLVLRRAVEIAGGEVHLPLELKPQGVSTSVTVKPEENDTKNPAPVVVSDETLRDAPNVNERFESSLPLVPGVVRGQDGHINLKGTRNTQSGALVNSANVTDPVTGGPAINLPVDVVAAVKVISNPYDPQYGKFAGAVTTAATKTSDYQAFHFSIQNFLP